MSEEAPGCPWCGAPFNNHDCVTDPEAKPKPGDITLCFHCNRLSVFAMFGRLRKPTPDELFRASRDERIKAAVYGAAVSPEDADTAIAVARHLRARLN